MKDEAAGRLIRVCADPVTVDIYQIVYSAAVERDLDWFCKRYDCRAAPAAERRETAHMLDFWRSGQHRRSDYCGLLSPKFNAKAKITASDLMRFVAANPGYDVYFINPFPPLAYLSFNAWELGEHYHPGLCAMANGVLAAAGYDLDVTRAGRHDARTLLYANYWVGSAAFWDRYMAFIARLAAAVEAMPEGERARIFAVAPHSEHATYYPFIFERMFTTFLALEPGIKFLAWPHSRADMKARYYETEMQALVVEQWADMIDRWDAAGTYSDDQRCIFAGLLGITDLFAAAHSRVMALERHVRR